MSTFRPGTPAADMLERLDGIAAAVPAPGDAPQGAPDAGPIGPGPGRPFLTVLVRTQGRRREALEDTLLTLAAQTCDDFEVLVLAHDPAEGTVAAVEESLAAFHPRFAERVRVLTVVGGGRSRPLNEGARAARGRYLAMLDDDDIAFAHWVASFKEAAERAPDHVVRTCVATQIVRLLPGAWAGEDGYEAVSRPHVDYPIVFDYLDHLVDNRTPNNGYAVPRAAVCDLGLGWDESLPVLEDWDHLMRAVAVCGVESCATVSALLRAWTEGATSKTVHDDGAWKDAHRRVEERHTAAPVLLQRGAAARLRARAARDDVADRERARLAAEVRRLRGDVRLLSTSLEDAGQRLEAVDVDVAALQQALADAEARLCALRSSTTWRLGRAVQAPLAVSRRLAATIRARRVAPPDRGGTGPGDAPPG